jgi:hypothetical protein
VLEIDTHAEDGSVAPARFPERWTLLGRCRDAARERQELATQLLEVIEVHAGDDFLESPVEFGWV